MIFELQKFHNRSESNIQSLECRNQKKCNNTKNLQGADQEVDQSDKPQRLIIIINSTVEAQKPTYSIKLAWEGEIKICDSINSHNTVVAVGVFNCLIVQYWKFHCNDNLFHSYFLLDCVWNKTKL